MANFPEHRGQATGLLKTFFGIASAVGAIAFAALLAPSKEHLLLALGICPLVLGLPLSLLVQPQVAVGSAAKDGVTQSDPWFAAYAITLTLIALLTMHSLLASFTTSLRPYEDHRSANLLFFGSVIGLLACLPTLPLRCSRSSSGSGSTKGYSSASPIEDFSLAGTVLSVRFWLLFLALSAGEGAGLMVLNNLGQLVKSLDSGASDLQPVCVSTFSVANAVGRLVMGRFASGKVLPTARLLSLSLAGASAAYGAFALGTGRYALLLAMPVLGFLYGCLWSLQPLLLVELFGLRSYGSKYAVLAMAAVFGSTPLCRFVVPAFYEAHADENGWCIGSQCFQGSLFFGAAACSLGAIFAEILHSSMKHRHQKDECPHSSS
ncbi:unnamed protein product [Polarella glacialis]|uniref:Nodulin-like domain-containing protein n=2 Tax=Polarella glacialis TaxID=89957 RepID=A0A813GMZ7_POLGL|nr:unnamed protein product [Polarella glacialis]